MRQALAELAVEAERWEEACQLATDHPDLAQTVCLPWAEWLVARGSFQEARLAYRYCSPPKAWPVAAAVADLLCEVHRHPVREHGKWFVNSWQLEQGV